MSNITIERDKKMTRFLDPEQPNVSTLVSHIGSDTKKVLIVFWHGVGDVVMFLPILQYLRDNYKGIKFDIGLCKGS